MCIAIHSVCHSANLLCVHTGLYSHPRPPCSTPTDLFARRLTTQLGWRNSGSRENFHKMSFAKPFFSLSPKAHCGRAPTRPWLRWMRTWRSPSTSLPPINRTSSTASARSSLKSWGRTRMRSDYLRLCRAVTAHQLRAPVAHPFCIRSLSAPFLPSPPSQAVSLSLYPCHH